MVSVWQEIQLFDYTPFLINLALRYSQCDQGLKSVLERAQSLHFKYSFGSDFPIAN